MNKVKCEQGAVYLVLPVVASEGGEAGAELVQPAPAGYEGHRVKMLLCT